MIKRYVREQAGSNSQGRGRPFGVIVAQSVGDHVHVGWSQCNPSDTFQKDLGTQIAMGRMNKCPVIFNPEVCSTEVCSTDGRDFSFFRQETHLTLIQVVHDLMCNQSNEIENS